MKMKTNLFAATVLAVALALVAGLAGCSTFERRAEEKSATFDNLSASTQKRLERGKINVGDTQDMVYIALGNPDETRDIADADGQQLAWIYKSYWQQYEGTAWVGWRRIIVPNPGGRGYAVFHEPVSRDFYRTREDEVIRVLFRRGVVALVEQQRR